MLELRGVIDFLFSSIQHKVKPGGTSAAVPPISYKKQQIVSVLTTTDKKITPLQQRLTGKWPLKVDIDSESNLECVPCPFGGTATLVPPYPASKT